MSIMHSRSVSRVARIALVTLIICAALPGSASARDLGIAVAQTDGIDPASMLLTGDDAGADATQVKDTAVDDSLSHWARRRWERSRDGLGTATGPSERNRGSNKDASPSKDRGSSYAVAEPLVPDNTVSMSPDVASARQVYATEVGRQSVFREATDPVTGTFPFSMTPIGDESRGLSACVGSCNSSAEIYLHKRIVSRVQNDVSIAYIWGLANAEGVTDERARSFASLVVARLQG